LENIQKMGNRINDIQELSIVRINENGRHNVQDLVVREYSLTIVLNNQELVTLLCSPTKLEYLTLGFLLSAGLIQEKDDVRKLIVDRQTGTATVETRAELDISPRLVLGSSGGRTFSPLKAQSVEADRQFEIAASAVFSLVEEFLDRSSSFKNTGALHSAALCLQSGITIFHEDIGRHNAIDKVLGNAFGKEYPRPTTP
jgi:FdhD protein